MKYIYSLLLMIGLMMCTTTSNAQVMTEAEARKELAKMGVDEAELRARLLERGVDLDNIDITDPAKLQETRKIIEEETAKLKAEADAKKKEAEQSAPDKVVKDTLKVTEEVRESVEDGATVEEAVSEAAQEEMQEELPESEIYGQQIFRNNTLKIFRQSTDAYVPDNYIIGPGDEISVAIWGRSEHNFSQAVSKSGFIKPDRIARVYVSGLTVSQAREALKSKFARNYAFTDNTFDVNVIASRTINVNITGEVFNPGSFSLSAINNGFNALVASGGPTDIGSVRKIKLARSGSETKTLDVYKYLTDPLVSENYYLQNNDYLIVPVAEKVVRISGAVNRPFRYELIGREGLNELIKFAGGLKADALKRSVVINRIVNDEKVVVNVNLKELKSQGRNFDLLNGDVIEIRSIELEAENIVKASGSVELPGDFAFVEGMRISDLLNQAKVKEDAILSNTFLSRLNPDKKTVRYQLIDLSDVLSNRNSANNIKLKKGDELIIRSRSSFVDSQNVKVRGAVRIEGEYPFNGGDLKVSDAIFLSGGLTEEATDFAFILRDKKGLKGKEYVSVDLSKALGGETESDLVLEPNDELVVYNRNKYIDESFVSVGGSVREPMTIEYDSSLTVKKALLFAGGATYDASLNHIDIYRLDFNNDKQTRTLVANVKVDQNLNVLEGGEFKLQPFDQIYVRKAPEFELQRNIRINGEVKFPGTYSLLSENTKLSEVIKMAGGLSEEAFSGGATLYREKDDVGYIIVDLEKAISKPNSSFNAILQEGDVLEIPKLNNLVTVTGAVLSREAFTEEVAKTGKFSFVYEPGKNAKYYVDTYAGGVAKNGKSSRITVKYPNGELKKTRRVFFVNRYPKVVPGSTINVGYRDPDPVGEDGEKEDIDWGQVLADSVTQATTILTLVLLVNQIK